MRIFCIECGIPFHVTTQEYGIVTECVACRQHISPDRSRDPQTGSLIVPSEQYNILHERYTEAISILRAAIHAGQHSHGCISHRLIDQDICDCWMNYGTRFFDKIGTKGEKR